MEGEKVAVKNSPSRCPFCHDEVAPEQAAVCQDCLARHHDACWSEGTGCSVCSSQQRLVSEALRELGRLPEEARAVHSAAPAQRERAHRLHMLRGPLAPLVYLGLSLALGLAAWVAYLIEGPELFRSDSALVAVFAALAASIVLAATSYRVAGSDN